MRAMLIRTPQGLRGATLADHDTWTKFRRKLETMKPGTWLRIAWARPRNGAKHRKMFALLSLVAENSETYDTTEKALVAVKLCGGSLDLMLDSTTHRAMHATRRVRGSGRAGRQPQRQHAAPSES